MYGMIGDRQGMFPVSFVKIIDELPKETAQKSPTQSVQSNDTFDNYVLSIYCVLSLSLSLSLAWNMHIGTQKSTKPPTQPSSTKKGQGTDDDLLPKGIATRDFEPGSSSEIAIRVC